MTTNLNEAVARKMGWEDHITNYPEDGPYWKNKITGAVIASDELPPISSSWEVCAKFLVAFMRERGYTYYILTTGDFAWRRKDHYVVIAEIKDHDLALAACETFMEVKL